MDTEINVLALVNGDEKFIFLFDDANRDNTLRQLALFAADPEIGFSWHDAAMLSRKIRDAVPDEAVDEANELSPARKPKSSSNPTHRASLTDRH